MKRATSEDRGLAVVTKFARQWPLPSVGIPGTVLDELPIYIRDHAIFGAYIDRVIQHGDFRDVGTKALPLRLGLALATTGFWH